jgi:cellulose synthase/poly-beta-1,6-N-acetylglucosamine synthase-like glycosyltransferase
MERQQVEEIGPRAARRPTVSVVIPVYNDRARLDRCLAALARQRPVEGGFEVIVVDDGSNDEPGEVVCRYLFARLLRQANAGPAAARNRGVAAAAAPILAFLDADCVPDPDWLVELIRPLEDPGISGVQGRYVTRQRSLVARFAQLEIEQRYAIMQRESSIDMVGTYSASFRRAVFDEFGGFDTRFRIASGEDADFSFRVHRGGHRLVHAPRAVVAHDHPDTARKYFGQKLGRAYWRFLLYRKHPDKILRDTYTPQGLKLEVALAGALLASLPAPLLWPSAAPLAVLCLCLFAGLTLPFTLQLWRRDPLVGAIAPWMLLGRAFSLFTGLVIAAVGTNGLREIAAPAGALPAEFAPVSWRSTGSVAGTASAGPSLAASSQLVIQHAEVGQYPGGGVFGFDPMAIELADPRAHLRISHKLF